MAYWVIFTCRFTVKGGIELYSNTPQSVAANAVSATSGRTYGLQLNSSGQGVVNVPWANTTYSAASTTAAGLMSAADKSKLDKVSRGTYLITTSGSWVAPASGTVIAILIGGGGGAGGTGNSSYGGTGGGVGGATTAFGHTALGGAGGGGGRSTINSGAGGGSGVILIASFVVTANTSYTITIGAAGSAGTNAGSSGTSGAGGTGNGLFNGGNGGSSGYSSQPGEGMISGKGSVGGSYAGGFGRGGSNVPSANITTPASAGAVIIMYKL